MTAELTLAWRIFFSSSLFSTEAFTISDMKPNLIWIFLFLDSFLRKMLYFFQTSIVTFTKCYFVLYTHAFKIMNQTFHLTQRLMLSFYPRHTQSTHHRKLYSQFQYFWLHATHGTLHPAHPGHCPHYLLALLLCRLILTWSHQFYTFYHFKV